MSSKLVIVFATPQGAETPSIEVFFPTADEALAVSQSVRVGGTQSAWATYIQEVQSDVVGSFPNGDA